MKLSKIIFSKDESNEYKYLKLSSCLMAFVCVYFSYSSHATPSDDSIRIFDSIQAQVFNISFGWLDRAEKVARNLFFSLVVIEIAWIGIKVLRKRGDYRSVFDEFTSNILMLSIGLALIQLFPNIAINQILPSFEKAGAYVTGQSTLSPTELMDKGNAIAATLLNSLSVSSVLNVGYGLAIVFSAFVSWFAIFYVAMSLLILKCQAYILVFGGIIFIGFSGSSLLRSFYYGYLKYFFSVGIQLFISYLIVSLTVGIADQYVVLISKQGGLKFDFNTVLGMMGSCLFSAFFAKSVHTIAHSITSGHHSLSSHDAVNSAQASTGAFVGAGNAAIFGGAVAGNSASIVGGAASAVGGRVVGGAAAASEAFSTGFKSSEGSVGSQVFSGASNVGGAVAKNTASAAKDAIDTMKEKIKMNKDNSIFKDRNS